jgi:hypothetical protein
VLHHHVYQEPLLHPCKRRGVPHTVENGPLERVVNNVRLTGQTVRSPGSTGEEQLEEQEADLVVRG